MAWGSGRHQLGVASELPALSRERPSLMADPCDSWRFRGGSGVKSPSANAGDSGSIPGVGRCPGGGHGNPLIILAWRIPMDRGAWRATVCGVAKSWTQLSD